MTEKIIYTVPNVGSITFGAAAPFYCLTPFDGSSVGSRSVTNTAIGVDGQETSGITLSPRTIICNLGIVAYNGKGTSYDYTCLRQLQNEVTRIMNPLNTGTLTRVNSYGTYKINARPSETPKFEKLPGAACRFTVNFIADYPLWKSSKPKVFEIPTEGTFDFYNSSGAAVPFILSGSALAYSTFALKNLTTGQALSSRVNRDFDWEFSIDTETCQVLAQKKEGGELISANYAFSYDSDLDMVLVPGMNTFHYYMVGSGTVAPTLTITAYDRFLGVG